MTRKPIGFLQYRVHHTNYGDSIEYKMYYFITKTRKGKKKYVQQRAYLTKKE